MKRRLSRRLFLGGGIATTIALPFLDAMVPVGRKALAQMDTPKRLVFVHVRNGMIRTKMVPGSEGTGYTMPSLLTSLEPVRDHVNILTGLSNKPGQGRYTYPDGTVSNDGPGDHARDAATFLTAARIRKTLGTDIRNGISVDQEAANHLASFTPAIPSLVLTTKDGNYGNDSHAPVYHNNLSWIDETTAAPRESDPREVFNRLFGGTDPEATAAEIARRQRLEQSVLDAVTGDIRRIQSEVGQEDREKLEEYFDGIRHLEVRLEESNNVQICDPGMPPTNWANFTERADLTFELIRLAFACDRTRVVSLQFTKDGNYDFIGVSSGHHQVSHLESGNSDVQKIETINEWQVGQFAHLVGKFLNTTEGDGTLLDNSLILFGGGLDGTGHRADDDTLTPVTSGAVHRHTNLPLFLAGRGGGAVRTGRHIRWNNDEPIADLYISMLHSVGAMVDNFGLEGTQPLSQLS